MTRIPEGYVTIREVMGMAGVKSKKQIRRDIDERLLPVHKIPSQKKHFLFRREDAEEYVKKFHTPQPYRPKKCG